MAEDPGAERSVQGFVRVLALEEVEGQSEMQEAQQAVVCQVSSRDWDGESLCGVRWRLSEGSMAEAQSKRAPCERLVEVREVVSFRKCQKRVQ